MTHLIRRSKAWAWLLCAAICLTLACGSASSPKGRPDPIPAQAGERARVLFVLTSAGEQVLANGKRRKTGYFLSEFYEPHAVLRGLGHQISIATPEGKSPVIDPEGLEEDYWSGATAREEALAFVKSDPGVTTPLSLDEALR